MVQECEELFVPVVGSCTHSGVSVDYSILCVIEEICCRTCVVFATYVSLGRLSICCYVFVYYYVAEVARPPVSLVVRQREVDDVVLANYFHFYGDSFLWASVGLEPLFLS